jgi:cytochrome c553
MMRNNIIIVLVFLLSLFAADVQAEGDATRGQELADGCADCHGDDGLGDEDIPALAGMEAAGLRKALMDFKTGARVDEYEMMVETAADLSEQDIADLAAYFTTLPGA